MGACVRVRVVSLQIFCVEALTPPRAPEWGCIWRQGLQEEMTLKRPHEVGPQASRTGVFVRREDVVTVMYAGRGRGEDSVSHRPRRKAREEASPAQTFVRNVCPPQSSEKINFCC